ncbi:Mariner Mos1 transposase [Anthophora quadrimaculata]
MFKNGYPTVFEFLSKEGLTSAQIKNRLDGVYSDSFPPYLTVKKLVKLFKLGQETLRNDPRPNRPAKAISSESIDLVEPKLLNDRRLKTKEIAVKLQHSKTTVIRIIKEHLHMNKSPDLAPSDYYLSAKLESDFRGRRFNTDEEIQVVVDTHFTNKEENYFHKRAEMLPKTCNKCIKVKEDYIAKQ